jgi:ABC-type microcin C transport system permease subunit YejE
MAEASKQASKHPAAPAGRDLCSLLDLVFLPFLICQQQSTFAFMHFTPKTSSIAHSCNRKFVAEGKKKIPSILITYQGFVLLSILVFFTHTQILFVGVAVFPI